MPGPAPVCPAWCPYPAAACPPAACCCLPPCAAPPQERNSSLIIPRNPYEIPTNPHEIPTKSAQTFLFPLNFPILLQMARNSSLIILRNPREIPAKLSFFPFIFSSQVCSVSGTEGFSVSACLSVSWFCCSAESSAETFCSFVKKLAGA